MLVGLTGVFVNMVLLWYLTEVGGIYYLLSSLVAVETAILSNFLLNNAWTFRDKSRGAVRLGALCRYNLVCLGGMVTGTAILYILTSWFGAYYLAANLVAMSVTSLWNFAANASWTWRLRLVGGR
jgi:dolichol-phosphate mannosyltransferase